MALSSETQWRNPYVGPRPFRPGEAFYGRDRELSQLIDLLFADGFVLLQAPSGAGKTSLVQAGLVPRLLAEERFDVLPVARIRNYPEFAAANPYVLSVLLSFEADRPLGELAEIDLHSYLDDRRERRGKADSQVLIFDQLEELLSNPIDHAEKTAFMLEVGNTLRRGRRWALFVAREEYIGPLHRYLEALRLPLSTFRLEFMAQSAARHAIQDPARAVGVDFSEGAITTLVDDLRQMLMQRPDGTTDIVLGPHLDPVQLQIVCRQLWRQLRPNTKVIKTSHLSAVGGATSALADYYSDQVTHIATQTDVSERTIREWFEFSLITPQGFRSQALLGPGGDKSSQVLSLLQESYLVRADHRRGAIWFELAHDRLIEPVRISNISWREHHPGTRRSRRIWKKSSG